MFLESIARTLPGLMRNDVASQTNTAGWGGRVGTGQLRESVWLREGGRPRQDTQGQNNNVPLEIQRSREDGGGGRSGEVMEVGEVGEMRK